MQAVRLLVAGLAFGFIVGCSQETAKKKGGDPSAAVSAVVQGNTRFAADLYAKLRKEPGNIFFSPYSISAALAMTGSGARGRTAQEMSTVLGIDVEDHAVHDAFGKLTGSLKKRSRQGAFELTVASALWGQKGRTFLDSFLALNRECYEAGLSSLDFASDVEAARLTINAWTEEETQGRIENLLAPGVLDPLTRLVLTNAIYFKGMWAEQFEEEVTRDLPFHLDERRSKQVPMMMQTGRRLGISHGGTFGILELPYKGDALSMLVLLPAGRGGLSALEDSLTSAWLSRRATQAYPRDEVAVTLPKFTFTSGFDLTDHLKVLGMESAFFEEMADFSGIDGTRELFVDAAIHRAFIEVNEEGTEAAAATAVPVPLALGVQHRFCVDHPFLFLIRDNASGSILFMGRVVDPQPSIP